MIGWYGAPGRTSQTKVHFIAAGKPVCGWRPRKELEFQLCGANRHLDLIECRRCKAIAKAAEEGGKDA